MNLDIYAFMCGISVISVHAIVEAKRHASFLKKANTCKNKKLVTGDWSQSKDSSAPATRTSLNVQLNHFTPKLLK